MTYYETLIDLRDKVEWEGGVVETLAYGIKPDDVPKEIADVWVDAYNLYQELEKYTQQIEDILDKAGEE
jgi:hypothetical protein